MLQNAYFLAKIGADTAENEQHFAEIFPIDRRVADGSRRRKRALGTGPRVDWSSGPTDPEGSVVIRPSLHARFFHQKRRNVKHVSQ